MAVIELKSKTFELMENDGGHALESTKMVFDSSEKPYKAVYTGPNTKIGQVLVSGDRMLYQSIDQEGNLSAGEATIEIVSEKGFNTMVLYWRWLTGDNSSGVSKWQQKNT